jgi:transmembrane sensor
MSEIQLLTFFLSLMYINFPELLQKYLKGDCTEEEEAILIKWYNSFEGKTDPLSSLTDAQAQELKERMLNRIRFNIQNTVAEQSGTVKKRRIRIKPLFYWLSGAAAIALIVFSISLLNKKDVSSCNVQVTVNNLTESMYKVMLSDSSIVWLSPQSKLHYPKKFTGDFRTVSMEGEAFFEVSKDPKHPFVINSGEVITKVLGTSFRIQAYVGSASTEVSVVSGQVSISIPQKGDSEVLILPSQKVTYLKDRKLLQKNREEKSSSIRIW